MDERYYDYLGDKHDAAVLAAESEIEDPYDLAAEMDGCGCGAEIRSDLGDLAEFDPDGDAAENVPLWNGFSQATRNWLFELGLVGVHEAADEIIAVEFSRKLMALLVVLKDGG